eukprot:PhF_6_TR19069/c0_g1_i1/m.28035
MTWKEPARAGSRIALCMRVILNKMKCPGTVLCTYLMVVYIGATFEKASVRGMESIRGRMHGSSMQETGYWDCGKDKGSNTPSKVNVTKVNSLVITNTGKEKPFRKMAR